MVSILCYIFSQWYPSPPTCSSDACSIPGVDWTALNGSAITALPHFSSEQNTAARVLQNEDVVIKNEKLNTHVFNSIQQPDASRIPSTKTMKPGFICRKRCCRHECTGDKCGLTQLQSCIHVEMFSAKLQVCNHIYRGSNESHDFTAPQPSRGQLHAWSRVMTLYNSIWAIRFVTTSIQHRVWGDINLVRDIWRPLYLLC